MSVELTGCDPSFTAEVQRIAGVELRAEVVSNSGEPRDSVTQVIVECRDSIADLKVADSATAKRLERSVSLAETQPRARARLIALAIAELVSASWQEVESNPEPRVPAATPPPPEVRAAVRQIVARPTRIVVDVVGETRALTGSGAFLLGGAVRATGRLVSALTLRLDAGTDFGAVSRPPAGSVAIRSLQGSLGLGWTLDVGAVDALAWGGGRFGYARLDGDAANGFVKGTIEGPWWGPEVGADIILFPRALLHLTAGASAGIAVVGVKGAVPREANSVSVFGPWMTLVVGVGVSR